MQKESGDVHHKVVPLLLLSSFNDLLYTNYKLHILQELRMYNPNYLGRPYVVVLNKIDLPKVFVQNFPLFW